VDALAVDRDEVVTKDSRDDLSNFAVIVLGDGSECGGSDLCRVVSAE
jgi:hypothetical protein